jgi:replicative DNA helicase
MPSADFDRPAGSVIIKPSRMDDFNDDEAPF